MVNDHALRFLNVSGPNSPRNWEEGLHKERNKFKKTGRKEDRKKPGLIENLTHSLQFTIKLFPTLSRRLLSCPENCIQDTSKSLVKLDEILLDLPV